MKDLLLIAYHFPPYGGGSGVHRATKFFQYLPENGWTPHVLTTTPMAYEVVQPAKSAAPDEATRRRVVRALALDAKRHLGFKGRYIGWFGIPDRWASWVVTAVPLGIARIFRKKIDVIVVTFPIATAVLIGLILHRLSRRPLIVDFRDSMTEDDYPSDPFTRRIHRRIEREVMSTGSRFIFTAESARRMYLDRYPNVRPEQCIVIPNGYDEEDFAGIPTVPRTVSISDRPLRLVHAGLVYPNERDPRPFFRALSRLKRESIISPKNLRIELRAAGSEDYYTQLLAELDIADLVHLLPGLPYRDALQDIASADALLLLQAANCNHQIPAKAYEYLRMGLPILALTSAEGDTAALFRVSGGATRIELSDEAAIYSGLPAFLTSIRAGSHPLPTREAVLSYSRRHQVAALAHCLDELFSGASKPGMSKKETLEPSCEPR